MLFEEIFKQEGLYKASSFADGVAFKIRKNAFTDYMELSLVRYTSKNHILPIEETFTVYGELFHKNYRKVLLVKDLFKPYTELKPQI